MTRPSPTAARRSLSALVAALAVVLAGAPACTTDADTRPGPASTAPPTTGPGRGTPDAPARDGSLSEVGVRLTEVARLESPTQLQPRPGTGELWVTERAGRVRRLLPRGGGRFAVDPEPVVDRTAEVATDGELGMLGLAFSADGRQLYVDFNDRDGTTNLVRYPVRDDGSVGSPTVLLTQPQPYTNHDGGDLQLGPDGYLYLGLGDGGSADDPDDRAGDPNDLLGTILRIDPRTPSGSMPYAIPTDNPYAEGGGRPEIYLAGVRNPWRFSFDRANGDLWIGDVGQDEVEEVDHLPAGTGRGADLGWSGFEGTQRNIPARVRPDTVPPVFEYRHATGGCSITGGVVYRGEAIPALDGTYLFSDYCQAALRGLRLGPGGRVADERGLGVELERTVSIDQDAAGEVYLLSVGGPIMRLEAA